MPRRAALILSLYVAGCTGNAAASAADRPSPAQAPRGAGDLPPGHPPISESVGDVKVEKAPGKDGRTVAEIYASRTTLKGTQVVVRGTVVKWNAGILGRNWMHLRDGSGSPQGHDNDLAVTTSETVAKGDVVLVRGTLALDQDFGAGYVYPVILQDAKLVK